MTTRRGTARVLMRECRDAGLPPPVAELHFHPTRRWRFDLAWPDQRIAVEIEGGAFAQKDRKTGRRTGPGRHTRGAGFRADVEKYGEAFMLGWRVLRVLPEHITKGYAIAWLTPVLSPCAAQRTAGVV